MKVKDTIKEIFKGLTTTIKAKTTIKGTIKGSTTSTKGEVTTKEGNQGDYNQQGSNQDANQEWSNQRSQGDLQGLGAPLPFPHPPNQSQVGASPNVLLAIFNYMQNQDMVIKDLLQGKIVP